MQCFVYRSTRREDTYLFLAEKDNFEKVPEALLQVFGRPEFSFSFELDKHRNLVRENPAVVLENLRHRGFHLLVQAENEQPL